MSDLLRIGSSAMGAAYAQLQTTGQNIANVNTPGYTRREVQLQEAGSMDSGGWVGRGVDVMNVRRVYDAFLVRESAATKASAAQDTTRSEALGRLAGVFSDPQSGLGAAFDDLVGSFTDVVARPSDPAARSAVVARADAFATRAQTLDTRLLDLRQSAQSRMQNEISKANQTLKSLASLNAKIADARGSSGEPNALLDQRDKLLQDLNGSLRANATIGQDGTITVTSTRGEPLVVGDAASTLQLVNDPLDSTKQSVQVVRSNGVTLGMDSSELGGALAGLAKFANEDVDAARAQLGRLYASVAGAFNARQAKGLDATGAVGQDMFSIGSPTVTGATSNTGSAVFGAAIADPTALKASDYELKFSGGQYTLTRLSDDVTQTFSALPQTIDGLSLSLGSGTPSDGDRFLVRAGTAYTTGARSQLANGQRIATAQPVVVETGAANAGDLRSTSVDASTISAITGATVTLTFTGPNTFSVNGAGTGNPASVAYTPGMTVSYNGWSVVLDGTPSTGDTMRISATP
ncbi:MAG: flagellar hook-associated protein FlgK, partial [Burkholderiales bacterium]